MTQQTSEQRRVRCLLCINQVKQQGDVCPQCEPRYMALGRALIEYERQLKPVLDASPHKHIGALMRFAPDVYFALKELDEPIPYEDKLITHRLTVMSLKRDGSPPVGLLVWAQHPQYVHGGDDQSGLHKDGLSRRTGLLCPDFKLEASRLSRTDEQ